MPWQEITTVSLRLEFVRLALQDESQISTLCRRFGISRKTGYKWLHRYREEGEAGLHDRSRRPHHLSRQKVSDVMEQEILRLRAVHRWGGRKIRAFLLRSGWSEVPSASTVDSVLKRHHCLRLVNRRHQSMQRFTAESANDLWQMDFKGPVRVRDGIVEPLTVLDDHSRFSLGIRVCQDKRGSTVKWHLTDLFRTYGLPWRLLADNGQPWGGYTSTGRSYSAVGVWLISLGVQFIRSRPYHPQTCGKEERFHRTLKQELTGKEMNCLVSQCQERFDAWRDTYNLHRPHEALDMAVPADRYQVSNREFPDKLPEPEYDVCDEIRSVRDKGRVRYGGVDYRIGEAFKGYRVAIRATDEDHRKDVYFYRKRIAILNTRSGEKVLPMSSYIL